MKKLDGRVAVITGGSKGLGKAIAIALAAEGAKIALVSRNQEQLAACAADVRERGGEVECFAGDVTREQDVLRVEREVVARFGAVHILINNAGVNLRKPVTDFTVEEFCGVLDTSIMGAFLMCRSFVPHMKGHGYGRILNLTSTMAHVSIPGRTAYSSAKFGLLGFTKALALELAPEGITVNGISPGPFATEMNKTLVQNPELNEWFVSRIPLGRWGKVEEVGGLAAYLCSEEAAFITGTDVLIDGGWTAQ